jgi:hypothetical protein
MLIQISILNAFRTGVKDNAQTEHQARFCARLEQQIWMDHISDLQEGQHPSLWTE